ncbi:MAG: NAD-dependent epimerase/dehydratase family protein [Planctomycetales bacterium]|nr:NAD-dependent epimerase/dehydratase family protein [Planctomycetales bacterium]
MNLVTGAGGFLGRYIVEQLLARGESVRGFARGHYPELVSSGVEMVQGDIRDAQQVADACGGVHTVYHVAAVAGIWGPWERYHGINTVGTDNVIAGCRKHGVTKLVFSSSPSVTFDGRDQNGVDESAPYPVTWLCHYPHTKALAEQAVLAANDDSLSTCALRPHLIWGPRDQHLIPRLTDRARAGKLRIVGDGKNLIDMIYVENAASAHLLAADAMRPGSKVCGSAYFLSQDEPVNCWDWINDILALVDIPPVTKRISLRAAWNLGHLMETGYRLLGTQSEPRMTRFLAAQLATSHYFDISNAKADFGYKPSVSTDEGMRRLANSLLKR